MKKAYIYALVSVIAMAIGFAIGYFLQKPKDAILPPEPEQSEEEPEEETEDPGTTVPNVKKGISSWKPVVPVGTNPNLNINDTLA